MSDEQPVLSRSAANEAPALRKTGALPLRPGDPDRIGPYVSLGLLGSGGMGRVYLGRPEDGGPDLVAVKVIRPEYAEDIRFRRRFEREASVHERVRTTHMPRLCGTGFQDELLWMATEYLPGLDLAEVVNEGGPLRTATVWRLVAELGQALADLSAAGIVHRDLKPSNVLVSVRGAHVIDFGISKAADASAITGTGNRVGTPAYMSPEYLRTGECDTASDVFSLACTLVYAATGSAPFGDGTGVDVMHRVAFEEPNAQVIGQIAAADAALASLLSACLAKEPGSRPTPRELMDVAGAHAEASGASGTSDWPEPLGGRVLARQQAYEALCLLPLAPADPEPPEETPGPRPSADAPAESSPTGARTSRRRKRVLAGATGVALCAVAAGVFVLTRPGPSATASPETGTGSAAGRVPTDSASSAVPKTSPGAAAPDGGSSVSEVSGKGDSAALEDENTRLDASGSPEADADADADADGRTGTDPSTPADEGDAPTEAAPSPSSEPPDSGAPAWISDCTHYSGNGRTRLGNSGKRVLQVQCMLTKRGYGVGGGGVDGEFDSGTESAVQAFQSDYGLDADGVVAHDTWGALRGAG